MIKQKIAAAAFSMMLLSSWSWAMDIYDWRAETQRICSGSCKRLDRAILANMAGGRPENLVVKKIKENNGVQAVMDFGVDDTTAQIIITSLVHSFFADARLRNPLNSDVGSYLKAFKNCSTAILKYDPDGSKTVVYWEQRQAAEEKLRAQKEAEQMEVERREQEEYAAKQEASRKAAEEEREKKEQRAAELREAREAQQKQAKAAREEERRIESEKAKARAAERQKQHEDEVNNLMRGTSRSDDRSTVEGFIKGLVK
jgi:hypothetical protein